MHLGYTHASVLKKFSPASQPSRNGTANAENAGQARIGRVVTIKNSKGAQ
jgi:hypothetical protein